MIPQEPWQQVCCAIGLEAQRAFLKSVLRTRKRGVPIYLNARAQYVQRSHVRDWLRTLVSMEALRCYNEAQLLGNSKREAAIMKVLEGIACFESLDVALQDAKENIQRFTKSDFMSAHFYELVKAEVLRLKERQ